MRKNTFLLIISTLFLLNACWEGTGLPDTKQEICNNGIDDDGDMRIDCADADCHTFSGCPVPTGEVCYNYIDDDGDGKIDCEDDDCLTSVRCAMARNYENGSGADDPTCNCRAAGAKGSSLPITFLLLFGFAFIIRRTRL